MGKIARGKWEETVNILLMRKRAMPADDARDHFWYLYPIIYTR